MGAMSGRLYGMNWLNKPMLWPLEIFIQVFGIFSPMWKLNVQMI